MGTGTKGSEHKHRAPGGTPSPGTPGPCQRGEHQVQGLRAPPARPPPTAGPRACPHLQPFDGLLTARGKQQALVQAGHGGRAAGQARERGRGAHAHQGVGHCGEIVRGLTQRRPATVTVTAVKVAQVYGRGTDGGEKRDTGWETARGERTEAEHGRPGRHSRQAPGSMQGQLPPPRCPGPSPPGSSAAPPAPSAPRAPPLPWAQASRFPCTCSSDLCHLCHPVPPRLPRSLCT